MISSDDKATLLHILKKIKAINAQIDTLRFEQELLLEEAKRALRPKEPVLRVIKEGR